LDNATKANKDEQKISNKKNSENPETKKEQNKQSINIEKISPDNKKIEDDNKSKTTEKIIKHKTSEAKDLKEEKVKEKSIKDDFRYIVRIANTDIDGGKTLERGLTSIKGIGMHMSTLVIDNSGLDRNIKMGNLTDKQIEKIQHSLEKIVDTSPNWMLNHQKDTEIGKDTHYIGSEIEMKLRDEINIMKKIRSYKGIRHERGLTVRGQRTRANNRKGLSLGVSKKGVQKK
jgi:small subunit ribosomal protein S13